MTHDELLKKVSPDLYLAATYPSWHALRSVVQLHKPYLVNDVYLCDVEPIEYPCPTIQAIEWDLKELHE